MIAKTPQGKWPFALVYVTTLLLELWTQCFTQYDVKSVTESVFEILVIPGFRKEDPYICIC